MAGLIRFAHRTLVSSAAYGTHFHGLRNHSNSSFIISRSATTATNHILTESPDDDLLTFINSMLSRRPLLGCSLSEEPVVETFESFTVEFQPGKIYEPYSKDRYYTFLPGTPVVVLNKKFGDNQHIRIEAEIDPVDPEEYYKTYIIGQEEGVRDEDKCEMFVCVEVSKEGSSDALRIAGTFHEPRFLEIEHVYVPSRDKLLAFPYTGPPFFEEEFFMRSNFARRVQELLKAGGFNEELFTFMLQYLLRKEKIKINNYFQTLQSFIAMH